MQAHVALHEPISATAAAHSALMAPGQGDFAWICSGTAPVTACSCTAQRWLPRIIQRQAAGLPILHVQVVYGHLDDPESQELKRGVSYLRLRPGKAQAQGKSSGWAERYKNNSTGGSRYDVWSM